MNFIRGDKFICFFSLKIVERLFIPCSILVFFVVADEGSVFISKRNHVYVFRLLFIIESVDAVVFFAFAKPGDDFLDHLLGLGVMAVHKTFSDQRLTAPFVIIGDGLGIHVDDLMSQIADHHGSSVLVNGAFEIGC